MPDSVARRSLTTPQPICSPRCPLTSAPFVPLWLCFTLQDDVKDKITKLGATNPLVICLRQEIDRLQGVISLTRKTLKVTPLVDLIDDIVRTCSWPSLARLC